MPRGLLPLVGAQKQFDLLALAAILRSISRVEACPTLAQIRAQRESGVGTQKRRRGPGIHLHGLHPFGTPIYVVAKVRYAVRALRRGGAVRARVFAFFDFLKRRLGVSLSGGRHPSPPLPFPFDHGLPPSDVQVLAAARKCLAALPKSS
jgi:hypothetical protein